MPAKANDIPYDKVVKKNFGYDVVFFVTSGISS